MAWYQVVLLNLETQTAERFSFERASDSDALKHAGALFRRRRGFLSYELWQRGRLLHKEAGAAATSEAASAAVLKPRLQG